MKKNKKFMIVIGIVLFIAVIGISYAWLSTTIFGKKEYVLKAGDLDLVLDETSNGLMIEDDLPVEDSVGLLSDGATFSVRNNGSSNICYQIYLDDSDLLDDEVRVEDKFVKYSIEKEGVVGEANVLSSGRLLDDMEIRAGKSVNYKLRLWFNIGEDGEIAGQVFRGKLRIEAVQCGSSLSIMKSYAYGGIPDEDYHREEYRQKIKSVVTKKDTNIPTSAISVTGGKGNYFDVSEASDASVIAYLEEDTDGLYKLTLGGNKGISATSTQWLFAGFNHLTSVDLRYLDTSNVSTMQNMFLECSSLQNADFISTFNTSNCVNIGGMFEKCSSLQRIDVSSFDTKNLQFANSMFRLCTNLKSITFGRFDTSHVTYFQEMFYGCSELTVLDLTMFDTSKKIYMNSMFFNCTKLVNILVSDKWVTGDTGTYQMFGNCGTDHVTVVSV